MGYGNNYKAGTKTDRILSSLELEAGRTHEPRKPGVKSIVLDAYNKHRKIEDAYLAVAMANERIGKEVFTKQMVDNWIKEYVEKEEAKKRLAKMENER